MNESLTQQELVERAKLAYSLGLISEEALEASASPGYDGWGLPYPWEIEHELMLRRIAGASRWTRWWWRLCSWFDVSA